MKRIDKKAIIGSELSLMLLCIILFVCGCESSLKGKETKYETSGGAKNTLPA